MQANELWQACLRHLGEASEQALPEVFHFCAKKSEADELAALVLEGSKRATAGLVWEYEADGALLPKVGERSIVTDWDGDAVCVIENTRIDICAYEDVDQDFATTEGEGDKSLDYWRKAHWAYFSDRCAELGRQPDSRMMVVCQRFKVLYTAPSQC